MAANFENGIFVLLQPHYNLQSEMVSFTVKFYNSTEHTVHFISYFSAYFQGEHELEETVYPDEIVTINGFQFSEFNNNPTLEIKLTIEPDDGETIEEIKSIKFKPKTITAEPLWLNQEHPKVFVFELFRFKELNEEEDDDEQEIEKPEVDTELLKQMMMGGLSSGSGKKIVIEESKHKIDLHIEAINKDYKKLSRPEIIDVQMRLFEQTLERAIAAGEHSLIAIHGVGAGVLKKKIIDFCKQHPRVKSCAAPLVNNYGEGATEIFFK
jgi:hypothetical protein